MKALAFAAWILLAGCGRETTSVPRATSEEDRLDLELEVGHAKIGCQLIFSSLKMWKLEHGAYPATLDELDKPSDLFPPDPDGTEEPLSSKRDPWGNLFVYELEDGEPRVTSRGPDGKRGTKDDIVHP